MTILDTFEGGCHCGAVRFQVIVDKYKVDECNCSICLKKGFLHLIVPSERFTLLQGAEALTTYTFNTGVAKHTFCRICGYIAFIHRDRILMVSASICAVWMAKILCLNLK